MGLPARELDNVSSSATERRRGGVQPPLLNQIRHRDEDLPSPPPARNAPNRQIEMARLLKSCGVRFYWSLAQDYPAELIEAKVAEWEEGPETGPGMLVRMIQQGGPIVEASPRRSSGADWFEERYRRGCERLGKEGTLG